MNIILKSLAILFLCLPSGAYAKQLVGDDFTKACSGGVKTCHLVSNDRGASWVGPFCGPCTAPSAAGVKSTGSKAGESDSLITIRSANGTTSFKPGEKFPQLMGGEEVSIGSGLSGNFTFQIQGSGLEKVNAGPGAVFRLKYLNASDGWVLESRNMSINVTTKDGSTTLTPGSNLKLIGVHANAATGTEPYARIGGNVSSSQPDYARIGGVGNATSTFNGLAYPTTSSTEMLASGRVVASLGGVMPSSTLSYNTPAGANTVTSTLLLSNGSHNDKVTNDREKIAPAPTYQLGLGVLFIQAKQTLQDLAEAYSAKRRTAFMKLVSPDFSGDTATFEEALVKDFRTYSAVNLSITPDSVVAQGDMAAVEFHYNLTVVSEQGINKTFSGRSNYTFREEDGKVRLFKMEKPVIFGNSLPSSENPMDAGQNSLAATESSAPGMQGAVLGSAVVEAPTISTLGVGFSFETHSATLPGDSSTDIFVQGTFPSPLSIYPSRGGTIVSIGDCNLESVTSMPGTIGGIFATANVGECYALKTGAGKYAVIRVTWVPSSTVRDMGFTYKFQPSGSNAF